MWKHWRCSTLFQITTLTVIIDGWALSVGPNLVHDYSLGLKDSLDPSSRMKAWSIMLPEQPKPINKFSQEEKPLWTSSQQDEIEKPNDFKSKTILNDQIGSPNKPLLESSKRKERVKKPATLLETNPPLIHVKPSVKLNSLEDIYSYYIQGGFSKILDAEALGAKELSVRLSAIMGERLLGLIKSLEQFGNSEENIISLTIHSFYEVLRNNPKKFNLESWNDHLDQIIIGGMKDNDLSVELRDLITMKRVLTQARPEIDFMFSIDQLVTSTSNEEKRLNTNTLLSSISRITQTSKERSSETSFVETEVLIKSSAQAKEDEVYVNIMGRINEALREFLTYWPSVSQPGISRVLSNIINDLKTQLYFPERYKDALFEIFEENLEYLNRRVEPQLLKNRQWGSTEDKSIFSKTAEFRIPEEELEDETLKKIQATMELGLRTQTDKKEPTDLHSTVSKHLVDWIKTQKIDQDSKIHQFEELKFRSILFRSIKGSDFDVKQKPIDITLQNFINFMDAITKKIDETISKSQTLEEIRYLKTLKNLIDHNRADGELLIIISDCLYKNPSNSIVNFKQSIKNISQKISNSLLNQVYEYPLEVPSDMMKLDVEFLFARFHRILSELNDLSPSRNQHWDELISYLYWNSMKDDDQRLRMHNFLVSVDTK